jgi:hypothetical protein
LWLGKNFPQYIDMRYSNGLAIRKPTAGNEALLDSAGMPLVEPQITADSAQLAAQQDKRQ